MKILLTGASKGIGRGVATVLGKAGHAVGLIARSEALLEEVEHEITTAGGTAAIAPCDLRRQDQVDEAVGRLVERLAGVDALVNNAGLVIRKDVLTLSTDEWRAMMETNVDGVFYATRAVLPHLVGQQRGHIVNISSISGYLPLPGGSGYAASKYAVTGFSESLFQEVRKYGIKVTTVFPGSVDSASHRQGAQDASWKVRPEEVGEAVLNLLTTRQECCISRLEIRPLAKPPG